MKLVSIVLPTYNGEKFLRQSIESVLNQTYQNWELIIVNDCSTDSSLKIAEEYAKKDSRVKVISNSSNKKLPASLNAGFDLAKGEYWTWTSDDNWYLPDAIEKMARTLDNNPDVGLIYANMVFVNEQGKEVRKKKRREAGTLFTGDCIGACFLYRASDAKKAGKYREDLFCAEDYEFWLRLYCNGVKFKLISEFLYFYRMHGESISATKKHLVDARTAEIKLEYYDKFPASNRKKCSSLFKQYRRILSPELLEKIYQKAPVWGRIFRVIKGIKKHNERRRK